MPPLPTTIADDRHRRANPLRNLVTKVLDQGHSRKHASRVSRIGGAIGNFNKFPGLLADPRRGGSERLAHQCG